MPALTSRPYRLRWSPILTGLLLAVAGACASRRPRTGAPGEPPPLRTGETIDALIDPVRVYLDMGLLAEEDPIPFVGSVASLASPSPDTTLVMMTLSLPNRAFTFTREGDRYRATYQVLLDVRQGSATVRHIESHQVVRVTTFKETTRSDESVIFQQTMRLPPGQYVFALALRDEGSAKNGRHEILLNVPRLAAGSLATPVTVVEASARASLDSLPSIVASPRATAVFGRDSFLVAYLEGYGTGTTLPLTLSVHGDKGGAVWKDSTSLSRHGTLFSGTVRVPVSRLPVGVMTLVVNRRDTGDSARTPLFVSFGDDLPVTTFDQMVSYLRYFAAPERLKALRDTAPELRAAAWSAFLRETDPVLGTATHEALRDYFARVHTALQRFHDDSGLPGWLTDRGMVFVTLGDPDQVFDQGATDINQRGRTQVWEYAQYHLQLVFIDQTGFGRWRLTTSSDADFRTVARRVMAH